MIVVTGGAGFIGSNIIKKFNEIGVDDIIVVMIYQIVVKLTISDLVLIIMIILIL